MYNKAINNHVVIAPSPACPPGCARHRAPGGASRRGDIPQARLGADRRDHARRPGAGHGRLEAVERVVDAGRLGETLLAADAIIIASEL